MILQPHRNENSRNNDSEAQLAEEMNKISKQVKAIFADQAKEYAFWSSITRQRD
jgi:hypothetical protein